MVETQRKVFLALKSKSSSQNGWTIQGWKFFTCEGVDLQCVSVCELRCVHNRCFFGQVMGEVKVHKVYAEKLRKLEDKEELGKRSEQITRLL